MVIIVCFRGDLAIAYLYRRVLENDVDNTVKRIKTIILEGMTKLEGLHSHRNAFILTYVG